MKNIKIAICDDSENDTKDLCGKLELYGKSRGWGVAVRTFASGTEFLEKFQPVYDMIFLDVRIPDMAGDLLAGRIREMDRRVPLIFISSYMDAVIKGYKLNVQAYIRKPASYHVIEKEMDEAMEKRVFLDGEFFLEDVRGNTYKIFYSQLAYVETDGRGSILHYNGDIIQSRRKIGEYEKILNSRGFYRCNNSYLVNLRFVEQIRRSYKRYDLVLVTGERIPMSRINKEECIRRIQETLN